MKAPSLRPPCRACGRDLINGLCSFCDVENETPPPPPSPSHRVFRAVELNPGATPGEICELLGASEGSPYGTVVQMLCRLAKLGALRAEGTRTHRVYYPADASKLPRPWARTGEPKTTTKTAKAKRALKRYHMLRKQGRCVCCGKERKPDDKSLCLACREVKKARRRVEAKPDGACSSCGCSMLPEWRAAKQCPECREKHRERRRIWRQRPEVVQRLNAAQRVRDVARNKWLKENCLCHDCERPADGFRCEDCGRIAYIQNAERIRERRLKHIVEGRCIDCTSPSVDGKRGCEHHLKVWAARQQKQRQKRAAQ